MFVVQSKVSAFRAMKSGLSADTYIEATSIEKHKQSYKDMELDKDAEDQIRSIARDPDPYTLMANSIGKEYTCMQVQVVKLLVMNDYDYSSRNIRP